MSPKIDLEETNIHTVENSVYKSNIQRKFDSFINKAEKGFFLGIADYVKYIYETPELGFLIELFKSKALKGKKDLDDSERKLADDIHRVGSAIIKEINNQGLSSDDIKHSIKEYTTARDNDKLQPSPPEVEALYGRLVKIIDVLQRREEEILIKKYIKLWGNEFILSKYRVSKQYYKYQKSLQKYIDLSKFSLWGSWDRLSLVYAFIRKDNEKVSELDKHFLPQLNMFLLRNEISKILNDKLDDNNRIEFVRENYDTHINRVHNFVIEQLDEHTDQKLSEKIKLDKRDLRKKPKQVLPHGWKLLESKKPQLIKDGAVVFTFPHDWPDKYKYFKCLWNNYGSKVSYKETYEYESKKHKYPEKGVTKVNRNIRTTVNKLRKEFKLMNLPIHIETNKGLTLIII